MCVSSSEVYCLFALSVGYGRAVAEFRNTPYIGRVKHSGLPLA